MSNGVDGRLTDTQIAGLETWLAHVDPHEPVMTPQLVLDAMQALIEEVREWRAGAVGAADVETLRAIRRIVAACTSRIGSTSPAVALLDRLLAAHGAKP